MERSTIATPSLVILSTLFAASLGALWNFKAKAQKKVESPIFPGISYAPGANFLLGHMIMLNGDGDFVQGYQKVFVEYADQVSGLCSLWFVNSPAISVVLSHHVKAILNATAFRESIKIMDCHNDNFLGRNALTSLMGKEWKRYRSAVHKSFTPGALKQSQSSINRVGNTLANSLLEAIAEDGSGSLQRPLLPLMKMATFDVFGFAAMDTDFHCCEQLQLTAVASAFEFLTKEYTRRLITPWNPASWLYSIPTAANRKQRSQRNLITNFIAEQIAKTRAQLSANDEAADSKQNLLANILRAAKAEDNVGGEMSDEAISDILMTLLFGGYDTTSITLSYALYLLAKHPEIQAECLKEVQSVLPTETATETLDGPEQLQYTRAVILETLRLFPPAPLTTRTMEKPMELDGHVIAKGISVFVPIWSIQRDIRNFPKPTDVRPERWVRRQTNGSDGWEERPSDDMASCNDVPPANKDAFCVFAAGARNCVGRRLAMQEAVTLLALLIRKLQFNVIEDGYQVKSMLSSVVQQPDGGLPMIITPRQ